MHFSDQALPEHAHPNWFILPLDGLKLLWTGVWCELYPGINKALILFHVVKFVYTNEVKYVQAVETQGQRESFMYQLTALCEGGFVSYQTKGHLSLTIMGVFHLSLVDV